MSNDLLDSILATRVINAAGTLTRLGGSLMSPAVVSAMSRAAECSFDVFALQAEASKVISKHTGAEAGMVTTGASAGLTLAAAACLAGFDAAKMDRLPDVSRITKKEIIIALTHRNGYDHALRLAGAELVNVGTNDRGTDCGIRGVEPWEYEGAICDQTAAIAFVAYPGSLDDLPAVVEVARRHSIPIIVDAAAQLPPTTNLTHFITLGCSLVVFSGGKAIGGLQASGILCGKRELIASAVLQQQDMDVFSLGPRHWTPPSEFFPDPAVLKGAIPRHGLGRGFKAGKEEIVGLMVALELFATRDDAAWRDRMYDRLYSIIDSSAIGLVAMGTELYNEHEGPVPVAEIAFASKEVALRTVDALKSWKPAIHVDVGEVRAGKIALNLASVREEDDAVIVEALRSVALAGSSR